MKEGDKVLHQGEVKEVDWVRRHTVVLKDRYGDMEVVPVDRIKPLATKKGGD